MQATIAIAIMAKAPLPGRCKTRLTPLLSPEQAADMSRAFLRDMTENLALAATQAPITPYIAFAPAGAEALFDGALAAGTRLILADGQAPEAAAPGVAGFGACLLHAARALLARGHRGVCLLNADSPNLPTACLTAAANFLASGTPGAVIGGAEDGGYYLLGARHDMAGLLADIDWSTERVFTQTCARAAAAGLNLAKLPLWYDVDDPAALRRLLDHFDNSASGAYPAPATRHCAARFAISRAA
jgi:rSAM/selenodomain-associated transferase 1